MYTILEASKIIGVSKQSIYKKISCQELQSFIKETEKGKLLTEKGLTVLKGMYAEHLESKPDSKEEQNFSKQIDNLQADYIASLKAENEHLKSIAKESGFNKYMDSLQADYISSLKAEIEHLKSHTVEITKLLENSQVLQKQQQEKILFLENTSVKEKRSIWDILKRN